MAALSSVFGGVIFTGAKYALFNKNSYSCARAAIDFVSGAFVLLGARAVGDDDAEDGYRSFVKGLLHVTISNLASNHILYLTNGLPLSIRVAGAGILVIIGLYGTRNFDLEDGMTHDILATGSMLSAATLTILAQAAYNRLLG